MNAAEETAKKSKAIPFMEEQIQPHDLVKRLEAMQPESVRRWLGAMSQGDRQALRERVGTPKILELIRGPRSG